MEEATNWAVFHPAAVIAAIAFVIAVYGTIAERRRAKRKNIDDVGFMPWRFIVFASMFTALIAAVLALKG